MPKPRTASKRRLLATIALLPHLHVRLDLRLIRGTLGANHLLQSDDVRLRLGDHARKAIEVTATVDPDTAVDVIARDRDQRRAPGRR